MKRLLLATVAVAVLAMPAIAAEQVGPKVDDWIQIWGPVIACPTVEGVDLFDQWAAGISIRIRSGNDTNINRNRRAAEQWAAMHHCEIRDGGTSSLWVINGHRRNVFDPNTPSYSTLRLCVTSTFVIGPERPGCTWVMVDKHNVRVSWGAGEKEPRQ